MKTKIKKLIKYSKSLLLLIPFAFLFSSCEEQPLDPVSQVNVSQGTYINIIHVSWEPVPDANNYNIYRQGPDGEWLNAGSVTNSPFDDYGFNLPDNRLLEGVEYNYRIVAGSSDVGDSDPAYSQQPGWIYEFKPIEQTVTRHPAPYNDDFDEVILQFHDPNRTMYDPYGNKVEDSYDIEIKYEGENSFHKITTLTFDNSQELPDPITYTDSYIEKKKAIFRITGHYKYLFKNMDNDYIEGFCENTFAEVTDSGGGGGEESTYNITNLNSLPESNNGYGHVELKNINGVMYAATILNPVLGSPVIYKLNGTSWQNISSSYPDGLQKNFEEISICGNGSTLWVAGVSDSAYVYSFDGNWSDNLSASNLGLTEKPENFMVEYNNNKLYALVDHDGKIEVYTSEQGTTWQLQSTLEDNVSGTDFGFKIFNNQLYVSYLITNSDYNSTLRIKHLLGSSWQTDFDRAYDNIMAVTVSVDNSGTIYFTSDTKKPDTYLGNVYIVTSTTSAQELIPSANTLITFPQKAAFDNLGNLVVLYSKIVSASSPVEMHLAVYENSEWKTISGDYTNNISPADIESNNGIYYVYGDGANVTSNYYPKILNAKFLTKQ